MGKNLPTYKITIDDEYSENGEDLGIEMIAYTSDPAIMVKGVYLEAKKFLFKDELKMIVAAPALIPDFDIYRIDDDGREYNVQFDRETIEAMSKKFLMTQDKSSFNLDHDQNKKAPSTILWNWITGDPETDISFTKYGVKVPEGSWFVVSQFHDREYFEEEIIKKDRIGYSVEGLMGIKLNSLINNKINNKKEEMSKSKKNKFFSKKTVWSRQFNKDLKKFEEVVTESDEVLIVEELKEGSLAEIVNENGEVTKAEGTYTLPDGKQVVVEDGVIVGIIEPETEEVVEATKEEEKPVELTSEKTEETEVKETELADEVIVDETKVEIDEEGIMKMVQPKFDEIYQMIAELKTMIETSGTEETEKVDTNLSRQELMEIVVDKIKSKQK